MSDPAPLNRETVNRGGTIGIIHSELEVREEIPSCFPNPCSQNFLMSHKYAAIKHIAHVLIITVIITATNLNLEFKDQM